MHPLMKYAGVLTYIAELSLVLIAFSIPDNTAVTLIMPGVALAIAVIAVKRAMPALNEIRADIEKRICDEKEVVTDKNAVLHHYLCFFNIFWLLPALTMQIPDGTVAIIVTSPLSMVLLGCLNKVKDTWLTAELPHKTYWMINLSALLATVIITVICKVL